MRSREIVGGDVVAVPFCGPVSSKLRLILYVL